MFQNVLSIPISPQDSGLGSAQYLRIVNVGPFSFRRLFFLLLPGCFSFQSYVTCCVCDKNCISTAPGRYLESIRNTVDEAFQQHAKNSRSKAFSLQRSAWRTVEERENFIHFWHFESTNHETITYFSLVRVCPWDAIRFRQNVLNFCRIASSIKRAYGRLRAAIYNSRFLLFNFMCIVRRKKCGSFFFRRPSQKFFASSNNRIFGVLYT